MIIKLNLMIGLGFFIGCLVQKVPICGVMYQLKRTLFRMTWIIKELKQ
jgi:hypothetical protein